MAASQQPNLTQPIPGTQTLSLVGSLGIPSNPSTLSLTHQNVNILQSQITAQQLAAFQSQQVAAAQQVAAQHAAGLRPAVVSLNLSNPSITALQSVHVLSGVSQGGITSSVPVNIITTGGQTYVQAVSNPNMAISSAVIPNPMVRSIAPNAATVVNHLQASQLIHQMRANSIVSFHQQGTQNPADANRVNAASPSVIQNKPVQSLTLGLQLQGQPAASTSGTVNSNSNQVLTKRKLQDLLHEIDPHETMDDDVEEVLLQIADDFIENVITSSCMIAKHRKSNTLDVKDLQLHLDRNWNMWIPGFGNEDLRPFKKIPSTEAHRQRMALIKKALKK